LASTIAFIPCRADSERVINKNTRPFAGFDSGLLELKLRQMMQVSRLDRIIVSSNDPLVLEVTAQFATLDPRIEPLPRPDVYGSSATSMGAFIREYIAHLYQDGLLFWSHVTHPFATAAVYNRALDAYAQATAQGHDCLVSATRLQRFLWRDGKPFNYDNSVERWPRSQDIAPVFEINHAIYAIPFSVMRATGDRVGNSPYFFEMPESEAMDIDWEDQFLLLEEIARARISQGFSLI
jgi:CMP-N-acetylneuraminic acid synthetase